MKTKLTLIGLMLITIAMNGFAQHVLPIDFNRQDIKNVFKEGVLKKGGKVWVVLPMEENELLDNGLTVQTNGIVKTSDGKTIPLSNRDCLGMNGNIIGLNENNINQAFVNNGGMFVFSLLDEPLRTNNGTTIMPNGVMTKNDGTISMLKNDEIIKIVSGITSTWKPSNEMTLNTKH
jgi:hypothetical protein